MIPKIACYHERCIIMEDAEFMRRMEALRTTMTPMYNADESMEYSRRMDNYLERGKRQ